LDPHYKGGSHWVGLVINLKKNQVYYFDSYGVSPPKQISRFMRYLTLQEPKLRLESNGRRFQFSNTECGMYSLYFIIRMIEGDSFKDFCKHPISDNWMIKFRKILFDETAEKNAL
jgi:Ulp1 family protease